jgi:hypothetical protein
MERLARSAARVALPVREPRILVGTSNLIMRTSVFSEI